ncbi:hypothetical protein ADUPG1_011799, partial [Aduncisulcus paluster]
MSHKDMDYSFSSPKKEFHQSKTHFTSQGRSSDAFSHISRPSHSKSVLHGSPVVMNPSTLSIQGGSDSHQSSLAISSILSQHQHSTAMYTQGLLNDLRKVEDERRDIEARSREEREVLLRELHSSQSRVGELERELEEMRREKIRESTVVSEIGDDGSPSSIRTIPNSKLVHLLQTENQSLRKDLKTLTQRIESLIKKEKDTEIAHSEALKQLEDEKDSAIEAASACGYGARQEEERQAERIISKIDLLVTEFQRLGREVFVTIGDSEERVREREREREALVTSLTESRDAMSTVAKESNEQLASMSVRMLELSKEKEEQRYGFVCANERVLQYFRACFESVDKEFKSFVKCVHDTQEERQRESRALREIESERKRERENNARKVDLMQKELSTLHSLLRKLGLESSSIQKLVKEVEKEERDEMERRRNEETFGSARSSGPRDISDFAGTSPRTRSPLGSARSAIGSRSPSIPPLGSRQASSTSLSGDVSMLPHSNSSVFLNLFSQSLLTGTLGSSSRLSMVHKKAEKTLNDVVQRISSLKTSQKEAATLLSDLSTRIDSENFELASVKRSHKSQLNELVAAQEKTLRDKEAAIASLKREIESAQRSFDARLAVEVASKESYASQLDACRQQLQTYVSRVEELSKTFDIVFSEHSVREKQQKETIDAFKSEVRSLKLEIDDKVAEIERTRQLLRVADEQVACSELLSTLPPPTDHEVSLISVMRSACTQLQRENTSLNDSISALTLQLRSVQDEVRESDIVRDEALAEMAEAEKDRLKEAFERLNGSVEAFKEATLKTSEIKEMEEDMSTRACRSATSLDTFITQLQMYREQVLPDIESGVTVVGIIKTELKDLVPQLRALLDKIAASMSHDNGASRKEMMAQKHAFETVLDSHTKSITSLDKALKSATCIQTKEEADLRERLNASCKCAEKYREDNS